MNCKDIRKLLIDFLEAELSESDYVVVRAHLHQCADCRKEKELLENTWAALEGVRVPAVSHNFTSNLMAKIHEQEEKKPAWVFTFPKIPLPLELPRLAPVMVSICFVAAVCFSVPYFLTKEPRITKDLSVSKMTGIQAVEKAAPFPPFPPSMKESKKQFFIDIAYEPEPTKKGEI